MILRQRDYTILIKKCYDNNNKKKKKFFFIGEKKGKNE
jgi:hypothetical protein